MVCHLKRFLFLLFLLVSPMLNITFLMSEFYHFFQDFIFLRTMTSFFSFLRSKWLSLERNLLMRKIWLKTTERLVWFGWADEKYKYWWWSVGFTRKSVVIVPSFNPTLRSRNGIFSALYSQVNFMYWLKSLSSSKNFLKLSSRGVQMKKISSIFRNHTKGCKCWPSRNLVSRLLIKIHAYGGKI